MKELMIVYLFIGNDEWTLSSGDDQKDWKYSINSRYVLK